MSCEHLSSTGSAAPGGRKAPRTWRTCEPNLQILQKWPSRWLLWSKLGNDTLLDRARSMLQVRDPELWSCYFSSLYESNRIVPYLDRTESMRIDDEVNPCSDASQANLGWAKSSLNPLPTVPIQSYVMGEGVAIMQKKGSSLEMLKGRPYFINS